MTNLEFYKKEIIRLADEEGYGFGLSMRKVYETKNDRSGGTERMIDWYLSETVLDTEEHRYLNDVIRPFRKKTVYICKKGEKAKTLERIFIKLKDCAFIQLPWFIRGEMYKNMEVGRHYTLKELGL